MFKVFIYGQVNVEIIPKYYSKSLMDDYKLTIKVSLKFHFLTSNNDFL